MTYNTLIQADLTSASTLAHSLGRAPRATSAPGNKVAHRNNLAHLNRARVAAILTLLLAGLVGCSDDSDEPHGSDTGAVCEKQSDCGSNSECVEHDLLDDEKHCLLPCSSANGKSRDESCREMLEEEDAQCLYGYCIVPVEMSLPRLPEAESVFEDFGSQGWSTNDALLSLTSDDSVFLVGGDQDPELFLEGKGTNGEWAPSGDTFGYFDEKDFVVVDSSGEEQARIDDVGSTCGWAWSPDGTEIVTTVRSDDGWELSVIDLDDGEVFSTVGLEGERKCSPSWSPDGERIYFVSRAPDGDEFETPEPLMVLHVNDDFELEELLPGSTESYAGIAEEGDGYYAFLSTGRESSNKGLRVSRADEEAGDVSYLSYEEGTRVTFDWAPDMPVLAVATSSADVELRLYDASSEESVYIYGPINIEGEAPLGFGSVAWSPDGERLAYTVTSGSDRAVHVLDVRDYLDELQGDD